MKQLTREEIIRVIEGKGNAGRVPILYDLWIGTTNFEESKKEGIRDLLRRWEGDVEQLYFGMPGYYEAPEGYSDYKWTPDGATKETGIGIDSAVAYKDWEEMEKLYENFPDPECPALIPSKEKGSRYRIVNWCYLLFERLWSLRGMENALTDFYLYPEEVHRLFQRLTDFYIRIIERAKTELDADGIFTTDDIGTQTAPFFSLEIFREFFKPYYKQIIDRTHELGMHFWLHTCGNVELFIPDLIEIGLDVLHPIQKHTMDEEKIAKTYGDKLCLLVGFDVQQIIPYGTEEEVRAEARRLIDICARPDGRFMLTMGNGSTNDWKLPCLEALHEETLNYGTRVFSAFHGS